MAHPNERSRGRLAGRGALITGSTGIAAASAELFAAEGARVFVTSRTEAHCRELAEAVSAAGGDAGWAVADLEDELEAEAAVAAAGDRLGRIDALFNVAGGSGRRFGDNVVHELTMEGWERTLARDAANVLVAGRCFSATHDAHASVRSMAQCMAMGQAAGTAGGLAATAGIEPRDVAPGRLRERLRRDGVALEIGEASTT